VALNLNSIFAGPLAGRLYGLSAVALGLVGLIWGDFASVWQPVPDTLPGRLPLAYLVAVIFLITGLALEWRSSAKLGALALSALYLLGIILLHLPRVVSHPGVFVTWSGAAEQLAPFSAAMLVYAWCLPATAAGIERLTRIARVIFGVCLIVFGLAHLFYMKETADFVPAWIPPNQVFWSYATAAGHFAAGIAVLTGVAARLATRLLTLMFIVFSILVHAPSLFADPHSHFNWSANAINFALVASAWVIAASYSEPSRRHDS
jgi:uncharacterized membrane protein YphA (DoxX/SURF4 family)